jgi:ABC-2 type transport system permease protein
VLSLLRSEMFKLSHRMMTRVLLLLVAGALLGTYLLLGAVGQAEEGDALEDLRIGAVHDRGMFILYQLGTITTIVLAASSIASEFSWGTIRTLLPRTAGRSPFLTAKLISLLVFVVAAVILGSLAAIAGSAAVTATRDLDSSLGSNFVGNLLAAMVRTAYAILPYGALAFVIALWSRSTAAGIALPIVIFYAEVLLTPLFTSIEALEWLPKALIYGANTSSLLNSDAVIPKEDFPSRWQAAGVLALYVTTSISLAYGRFLARDVM